MTVEAQARYQCNRCKTIVVMEYRPVKPNGWMEFIKPNKHALHLCTECSVEFKAFMRREQPYMLSVYTRNAIRRSLSMDFEERPEDLFYFLASKSDEELLGIKRIGNCALLQLRKWQRWHSKAGTFG